MEKPYYTVTYSGYKLIFLNTCYLEQEGKEKSFYRKNFKRNDSIYPIVPSEEVRWLQHELSDGMKYIIFSHHSLINDFAKRGVYNRADIQALFKEKQVMLCMNGHDHGDSCSIIDGIPYYTVNSANYVWCGSQITGSDILANRYADLNGMLQYKQALSVYVEIDDNQIRIYGMEGEYLSVTPEDIGLYDYKWNGVSIKPKTSSLCINLKTGEN